MAYIPPHKQQSKDSERPSLMPTPTLASLSHRFNRNVRLGASKSKADRAGRIVYSNYAISRWFAVGWNGHGDTSASHLRPVSVESFERTGQKPLVLDKKTLDKNEAQGSPCSSILEKVMPHLLSCAEKLKAEIERGDLKDVKLTMAARFGTILFQGSPSVNIDNVIRDCLGNLRRIFYTNLPAPYAANIIAEVASKIGVNFVDVKHSYQVKIELNPVRDMVIDISCMNMDLDLRLALSHKRVLTSLSEDEMQGIQTLINSAVLDPEVKGGLRWPFGKASSGNRYNVIAVWHTNATAYENGSIRLKVQQADRFDFRTTYGEVSNEVVLKLKGIASGLLQEQDAETSSVMLQDSLTLIWRHFLQCEPFLT
ncbi:hypothetical protein V6N11_079886 [Hibiscus sabdariffa]|uniref:DUF7903 domain-containing protein n=1 Tax=Hibiscus sabdariffa TaxID=183260 RepID=A0ABR2RXK7_9ROSI